MALGDNNFGDIRRKFCTIFGVIDTHVVMAYYCTCSGGLSSLCRIAHPGIFV